MNTRILNIVTNTAESSADISLRGVIGSWFYDAQAVAEQLRGLNVGTINVRINSMGGTAHDGIAIYNLLKSHKARKIVTVEGIAASAASVVAMAGDEIRMFDNSLMMIHGVTVTDDEGKWIPDDPAEAAFNQSLIKIYAARTGKTERDLSVMLKGETWFTASEAVAAGFASKVITGAGQSALATLAGAAGIPSAVVAKLSGNRGTDSRRTVTATAGRTREIQALCKTLQIDQAETDKFISSDKSFDEVRRILIERDRQQHTALLSETVYAQRRTQRYGGPNR